VKWLVPAVFCFMAVPMSAQPGDLFGGYSFARESGDDALSRHGWNAAAAVDLTGSISLVADAAGHYGSSQGVDASQLTLMAGPRFWYVRGERYSAFAHALAGLVRETASVKVLDVTISESENRLGLLSGAGLDVKLGGRWALRVGADYVWSTKDGSSRGGFRAGLGAAYRF
jgi:hypothetical protein